MERTRLSGNAGAAYFLKLVAASSNCNSSRNAVFPVSTSGTANPQIAVLPDWRKQGLAQFMLEQLEIVAKSANLESLWLEVNSANKAATALYYKQGYQETGIRKNYFINPFGDALLLKKILKYDDKQAAQ